MSSPEELSMPDTLGELFDAVNDRARLVIDQLGYEMPGKPMFRAAQWHDGLNNNDVTLIAYSDKSINVWNLCVVPIDNALTTQTYDFDSAKPIIQTSGDTEVLLEALEYEEQRREAYKIALAHLLLAPVSVPATTHEPLEGNMDDLYIESVVDVVASDPITVRLASLWPQCQADSNLYDAYAWEDVEAHLMAKYGIGQTVMNLSLEAAAETHKY